MLEDPGQVAGAVAVAVGEAPRIDLVDDAVAPVRARCVGQGRFGHRASLADRSREGQTVSDAARANLYSGAMAPSRRPAAGDRIRVGVAGLGAVAQAVHLPLLARLDDTFEIAALADLAPSLLARIGDRYG